MKKNLILLAVAALAVVACSKPAPDPTLSVDKTAVSCAMGASNAEVAVTSNTDWTVTPNAIYSWVTATASVTKGNGKITFAVQTNDGLAREAAFTVAAAGCENIVITVSQEAVPSNLAFGTPVVKQEPKQGVDNSLIIAVPYTGAAGYEETEFTLSSENAAFSETKVSFKDYKKGDGEVALTMTCKPDVLGVVEVAVKAGEAALGNVSARVYEPMKYSKCVCWNFWALGYTKAADHNLLRGSKYDYSWTSEATHATTSGVTSEHKVLPSVCTVAGNEEAYITAVSNVEIVAGGKTVKPSGDPEGLAGYTFNPGIQIKGLLKDDYFLAVLPKVSVAANGKITVASACAGAKAAANAWIFEYSADNKTWTAFDGAQEVEVGGEKYSFHMHYVTTFDSRYVYAKSAETDKTYTVASATVKSAINGALYVRLRACGLNGDAANKAISAGGWSDIKFLEVSFD